MVEILEKVKMKPINTIRNWTIKKVLKLRYGDQAPVKELQVDWIAENLIQAVALNVLHLQSWSIRKDGLSFEIPPDCFHKDFTEGYEILQNDYGKLYPRLRERCRQVFKKKAGGDKHQTIFIMNNKKTTVEADFKPDRINFRVVSD